MLVVASYEGGLFFDDHDGKVVCTNRYWRNLPRTSVARVSREIPAALPLPNFEYSTVERFSPVRAVRNRVIVEGANQLLGAPQVLYKPARNIVLPPNSRTPFRYDVGGEGTPNEVVYNENLQNSLNLAAQLNGGYFLEFEQQAIDVHRTGDHRVDGVIGWTLGGANVGGYKVRGRTYKTSRNPDWPSIGWGRSYSRNYSHRIFGFLAGTKVGSGPEPALTEVFQNIRTGTTFWACDMVNPTRYYMTISGFELHGRPTALDDAFAVEATNPNSIAKYGQRPHILSKTLFHDEGEGGAYARWYVAYYGEPLDRFTMEVRGSLSDAYNAVPNVWTAGDVAARVGMLSVVTVDVSDDRRYPFSVDDEQMLVIGVEYVWNSDRGTETTRLQLLSEGQLQKGMFIGPGSNIGSNRFIDR